MSFPQLSNIDSRIWNSIMDKTGKKGNLRASQTMPWIRVTSTLGDWLSMESTTNRKKGNKYDNSVSFAQKYGNTKRSGRLGITNDETGNKDVYAKTDSKSSRGLRPSPTISSISVKQGNEGLSKKTEFTIVCYSAGQADTLIKYFLEPGNMVCVEWGENTKASVQQKVALETCAVAALSGHAVIQKKRMAAGDMAIHTNPYRDNEKAPLNGGQYDAVLGYITGGGMKYGDNESYEISVELSSVGELPAYLQHHKGLLGTDGAKTALDFKAEELENEKIGTGQKMFMLMFNDLPSHKRHADVYNLGALPKENAWAVDQANFINFDKTLRENLLDQLSEGSKLGGIKSKNDKEEDIKIMTDMPLFKDKRYLKVSLAFTILDMQNKVKQAPSKCDLTPTSMDISWKNTILSSHQNQFSSNSEYLHIPNKFSPNWNLLGTLGTSQTPIDSMPPDERFKPNAKGNLVLLENKTAKDPEINPVVDTHPQGDTKDSPKLNYFPRHDYCEFIDQRKIDECNEIVTEDPYKWGFLRDLYINFDFFCDCISKSGVVTKDVYYDLLNGLSSAVNLNWDFQIISTKERVPIYHPDGDAAEDLFVKMIKSKEKFGGVGSCGPELQIIDLNFMGKSPNKKTNGIGLAKFQSRGIDTPFISCDFNMDIPGSMKSMVIAKGQSGTTSVNVNPDTKESYDEIEKGQKSVLFSVMTDSVKAILNPMTQRMTEAQAKELQEKEKEKIENEKSTFDNVSETVGTGLSNAWKYVSTLGEGVAERAQNAKDDKQSKANIEFFLNNVLIIPALQGDQYHDMDIVNNWHDWFANSDGDAQQFIMVGGWNDSALLKRIQRYNTQKYIGSAPYIYSEGGTAAQSNVPLLPIKFNFTIHGVSGLQVGNTFSIPDLPGGSYGKKIFQITSIEHSISQDLWTTSVEGSMRNLDAGSGTIKKYNSK